MSAMSNLLKTALTAALAALMSACGAPGRDTTHYVEGGVWNTTYHITYTGGPASLEDSVIAVMGEVEASLSAFLDSSTVSRVNAAPSGTVMADPLLRRCLEASRRVSALSGGAFDPTVGPLVSLWGFGPAKTQGVTPSDAAIDSALTTVGIASCYVDSIGRVIKKADATAFNFSAIAKGMGCDAIGDMLRRNGVTDYMVEIGGEIALNGVSPRGCPWRVQVDAPLASDTSVIHERLAVIELTSGGVATSGNYRNYRETDGQRAVHTISPATGRPIETATLSATVTAPDCMTADALATACMAMQPDQALAMIGRISGAEAMLVSRDPSGAFRLHRTAGFRLKQ